MTQWSGYSSRKGPCAALLHEPLLRGLRLLERGHREAGGSQGLEVPREWAVVVGGLQFPISLSFRAPGTPPGTVFEDLPVAPHLSKRPSSHRRNVRPPSTSSPRRLYRSRGGSCSPRAFLPPVGPDRPRAGPPSRPRRPSGPCRSRPGRRRRPRAEPNRAASAT